MVKPGLSVPSLSDLRLYREFTTQTKLLLFLFRLWSEARISIVIIYNEIDVKDALFVNAVYFMQIGSAVYINILSTEESTDIKRHATRATVWYAGDRQSK